MQSGQNKKGTFGDISNATCGLHIKRVKTRVKITIKQQAKTNFAKKDSTVEELQTVAVFLKVLF